MKGKRWRGKRNIGRGRERERDLPTTSSLFGPFSLDCARSKAEARSCNLELLEEWLGPEYWAIICTLARPEGRFSLRHLDVGCGCPRQ